TQVESQQNHDITLEAQEGDLQLWRLTTEGGLFLTAEDNIEYLNSDDFTSPGNPSDPSLIQGAFVEMTAGEQIAALDQPIVLDVDTADVLSARHAYLEVSGETNSPVSVTGKVEQHLSVSSTVPGSEITVGAVEVTGLSGSVLVQSVGDIDVQGNIFTSGSGELKSVSLVSTQEVGFASGSTLTTDFLNLSAGSAPAGIDLSEFDNVDEYAVEYTGTGNLGLTFNRDTDVKLARAFAQSGSVAVENAGTGELLIGYGGVTAGAHVENFGVTLTAQAGIKSYETQAADVFVGIGGGGFGTNDTLSANRVQPSTLPVSQTVAQVSWQGQTVQALQDRWVVTVDDAIITPSEVIISLAELPATSLWQVSPLGEGYYALYAPGALEEDVTAWLATRAGLLAAMPDFVIESQRIPSDPFYADGSLWGLENYGQDGGVLDSDIDAEEAWEFTVGSEDVVIGVIDTGVDYTHPDLIDNMWVNPGEIPGDGIDNDGNGFVDDVYGWDFYSNDNDPMDTGGHGTHVAGTIGAQGNNDMGIVGVAWEASLMALRFLGPFGGSTSGAIGAINYATMMKRDYDINVAATNNSWGGGGYNQALADAIVAGVDANILFVAAAGNFSNNNDVIPFYPTNYDVPGLISVAATNRNNNMAGFSHYGRTTVDIGAPGVEILSTIPGNGYAAFQGTSMAAPHVSGVAALLSAAYPQATVSQLKAAILGSAVPIPSLTGRTLTGGLLNAKNALDWMNHGTVAGGGQVRFVTNGDIDLATAAGSLVVEGTAGSVKLDQVGDVTIAATGLTADDVEIVIDGSMVLGQGAITANTLAVTATNDIDVLTDVTTLSAISESGYVSVIETNGLELVGDGIVADSDVTLVLESGSLVDGGLTIIGDSLLVDLRGAGDIDLKTVANQLSAKTFSGNIVIENVGSFAVGDDGILADDGTAGDAVFNDVTLKSTGGSIGAGAGTVSANVLIADADGAIAL
ncbi:MAG: S8 family peptidase, partial [Pirellulales bacterium]